MAGVVAADPVGMLVAFGAGILSFVSPCVLPLVPGYLSMVSGLSAAERGVAGGARQGPSPWPIARGILLFIAGFTVVFVALGAAASGLHPVLESHDGMLTTGAGALIVLLGAVMLVSALPAWVWSRLGSSASGRVAWLVRERRLHLRPSSLGVWAAPVTGMAFAFAWTPCIGPVLGAVLALASLKSTLSGGVLLLFAYSLGLGVPFLVTGLAFDRLTALYARARRSLAWVQVVAGAVIVAFGVVMLAGDLGWVSAQFSSLLGHLGLQRLTTS